MNLNPLLPPVPPVTAHLATMLGADATSGTARWRTADGRVRGPVRYQRPAPSDAAGDPSHTHPQAAPPDGTACVVLLIGGQLETARIIPLY